MEELLTIMPKYGVFLKGHRNPLLNNQTSLKFDFEDKRLNDNTRLLRLGVKKFR
jgi:hypothetical protein